PFILAGCAPRAGSVCLTAEERRDIQQILIFLLLVDIDRGGDFLANLRALRGERLLADLRCNAAADGLAADRCGGLFLATFLAEGTADAGHAFKQARAALLGLGCHFAYHLLSLRIDELVGALFDPHGRASLERRIPPLGFGRRLIALFHFH